MSLEKAIAAALEPLLDDVLALEKKVDGITLQPGPQGIAGRDANPQAVASILAGDREFVERLKGRDGAAGLHGKDGAGIEASQWARGGVYREGSVVVAYLGQHFRALQDTAAVPGESAQWARVGTGGFRHRGNFDKDAAYAEGDLFIKDFGTFCVVNGAPVMLAGRGSIGKTGETGARGERGQDGRSGSTIIGAQVKGFKLVLVAQDADGSIDHIEADFAPAYRELVKEAIAEALPDLFASIAALSDDVAGLKRNGRRHHA